MNNNETKQVYPLIPIFTIIRKPEIVPEGREDIQEVLAKEIKTKAFWYIQKISDQNYEVVPVEYDIFYEWQQINLEIDKRIEEFEKESEGMISDPDVTPHGMSQEEEMTYLRANDLYHIILSEYDNIVLALKTGEFIHDMQLKIQQKEYLDQTVFERAWEVNDIIKTANPLAQEKALDLLLDIEGDVPLIEADRTRLRQVLWNIMGNAIKFTEKGSVTLRIAPKAEHLLIAIRDTGIGIEESHISIVFEQFRQVDGSLERIVGGTGLGMPISKKLVELHGGDIWVESVVGQGSTFLFTLPYQRPQDEK